MKSENLKLTQCFIVESWGDEIEPAIGVSLPKLGDGFFATDKVLVKTKKGYALLSPKIVHFEREKAVDALHKERIAYKDFCQKQADEYSEKLKKFSNGN